MGRDIYGDGARLTVRAIATPHGPALHVTTDSDGNTLTQSDAERLVKALSEWLARVAADSDA